MSAFDFWCCGVAVEVILKKGNSFAVAGMARGRADVKSRKNLVTTTVLVLVTVGGFFYFYSQNSDSSSSVEYGAKSLSHTGLGGDKDDGVSSSTLVGGEVIAVPKSIPVS